LQTENDDLYTSVLAKEQELESIQLDIASKQQLFDDKTNQVAAMQTVLDQITADLLALNDELDAAMQSSDEYIRYLREQIASKEEQFRQIQVVVEDAEADLTMCSDNLNQLIAEKDLKDQDLATKNLQLDEQITLKAQAELDLQDTIVNIETITASKSSKELTLQQKRSDKQNKLQLYQEISTETSELQTSVLSLEEEISLLTLQIHAMQEEINGLQYTSEQTSVIIHISLNQDEIGFNVDKKIFNATSGNWEDTISAYVEEEIRFKITVKNTGKVDIQNISVVDIFPSEYLEYISDSFVMNDPQIFEENLEWKIDLLAVECIEYFEFNAITKASGVANNIANISSEVDSGTSDPQNSYTLYDEDNAIVNILETDNNPPVANDDYINVTEDSIENVIKVLENDTDPDVGDELRIISPLETNPINGVAEIQEDTIIYTPNRDYFGLDLITYRITDGNGGEDTANVSINIENVNDAPVASDDNVKTPQNTSIDIYVLENDTDIDGDILNISGIEAPSAQNGTASIMSGFIRYEPDLGFIGSDSFVYNISDGNGEFDLATVNILVYAEHINNPPVANDDIATVQEGSIDNVIDVLANDTDIDVRDILKINSVSQALHGDTIISGNAILYTPDTDFVGNDSFIYEITDSNGGFDTATVNVTVEETVHIIVKPEKETFYMLDEELGQFPNLIKFFECDAIAIGPITIQTNINEEKFFNVEKVEFYINDELKGDTIELPYEFTLNEKMFGIFTIKVVGVGQDKTVTEEMKVLIINFGLNVDQDNE
jgi:uncharacterized repeat protein (TIGR01451 family)